MIKLTSMLKQISLFNETARSSLVLFYTKGPNTSFHLDKLTLTNKTYLMLLQDSQLTLVHMVQTNRIWKNR